MVEAPQGTALSRALFSPHRLGWAGRRLDAVCRASGWNTRKREKGRNETGVGGVGVALSAEVQYSPGPISGIYIRGQSSFNHKKRWES